MENLTFRIAKPSDAAQLLNIYTPYVTNTAITFETTPPSCAQFKKRIETTLQRYPYIVAIKDEKIIGYAYTSSFKDRSAYNWSVETSIYLDSSAQGLGIGTRLYQLLEKISAAQNVISLNACIAYPKTPTNPYLNLTSPKFHEHLGFSKCAHFHDCAYKFDQWFDMIWMEKHLLIPPKPNSFIEFAQIKDQLVRQGVITFD
ncbi:GNAT family N-acetyltransferase [Ligilactobacillus sp. Marseille-Q7487]|uniref:GNAT family N-acetyltransferase n=1 Tax=Ligilactobacillus sp. Marseille-Q7487 TaxID=3022128 RepID=UPI0024A7C7EF|nr:GNAT family N-acetyltransferase [Ligilactobacillus sp. Marseille-Q7487]